MKNKLKILEIFLIFSILFGVIYILNFKEKPILEEAPILGVVEPYSFFDADGKQITNDDFADGVYIINFFFTTCPKICPLQMGKLSTVLKRHPGLKALSVSVDPENDTPEKLRDFLAKYNGDPKQWYLVKNDYSKVLQLANNLLLGTGEDKTIHTTRFTVVDKFGNIRGLIESNDDDFNPNIEKAIIGAQSTDFQP